MGVKNYLIEGGSCTGKTTVAEELQQRGYHVIHGDRELAYQGDPETGEPLEDFVHEHHIWNLDKVKSIIADQRQPITFFCGGSRNLRHFIDLFDKILVLIIDTDTLNKRLDARPQDEFGAKPSERDLIIKLHATKTDIPQNALGINASAPITQVVDEILSKIAE